MKPYKVECEDADAPVSMHDTEQEASDAALAYNEKQPASAPFANVYRWDAAIGEWQIL